MKKIIKYQTDDGCEFALLSDAQKHESMCRKIHNIMGLLRPPPEDSNGKLVAPGGVQQSKLTVEAVKERFLQILKDNYPHIFKHRSLKHMQAITRDVDDNCPGAIRYAWHRLYCIDNSYREWPISYHVVKPEDQ